MRTKRLIVDMSSVMWSCLTAGTDKEFGKKVEFEGKMVQVNSAEHGYENAINHFISVFNALEITPISMIMVVEGQSSKQLRLSIIPTYKGGSEKKSRPPEAYAEFEKLRERLVTTFTSLGAMAVSQDHIEADDVIAYLALNLKGERIIDTNDGDMAQLITDDGSIILWKFDRGLLAENHIGPFPCKYITVYKALVGDTSDKIPGAKDFGKTAWHNLLVQFGYEGLEAMEELIVNRQLDRLAEDVPQLKVLQKIIDDKQGVYNSYDCAKLYPKKVNTHRKPMDITTGMVKPAANFDDKRLRQYAQQVRLVHADNFKPALDFFIEKLAASPFVAFDIETSSCDEGDEWLAAAKAKSTAAGDDIGVDVFGSTLTGFSVTFGNNLQYTYYCTVDHVETDTVKNITKQQAKQMLQCIPDTLRLVIQNVAFELPVIMNELGPMNEEGVPE